MLKQTILNLSIFPFISLALHPLGYSLLHRRNKPAWATCLTANQGCRDIYALVQRCWDTGVPSGYLDPNNRDISDNFRTCFCGDTKTNNEGSWQSCAICIMNASKGAEFVNVENTDIVTFCASPDPNLYVWLTGFLNFTLRTDTDALSTPSPILSGPVTAISTLASNYSPDPSANQIPSGIYQLTTDTVSVLPTSSSSSPPDNSGGGSSQTTDSGAGDDGVLTVLYYTNSATSMYVVGPASELASLVALAPASNGSGTQSVQAEAETAAAKESVTTGLFAQSGRTVLIVGPAETGNGTGKATRQGGAVGAESMVDGRKREGIVLGAVIGVAVGVAVIGARVW